ncbi:MAG TPA: NAD(P)/FAD-dependent oxidoreductase, partial [Thermodesulfobacteriota bacterium]|nr:NAD(P)/FAD-dependent oxidoreductase [Thermodesulfobacteriota bacterium]
MVRQRGDGGRRPGRDVLVVGGGPAGLYAAQRLAQQGLSVEVFEEHERIGEPVHCTGIVGAEVFALPGVPRTAVLAAPAAGRFHAPAGHSFTYAGQGEEVWVIDRGAFDRALAERAVQAGAVVTTGARVVRIEVRPGEVALEVQGRDGRQVRRAPVCLLACGARYRFQRQLGLGLPPLLFGSAQTELPVPAALATPADVRLPTALAAPGPGEWAGLAEWAEP